MKIGSVSVEKANAQHEAFSNRLKDAGAHVIELPFIHGSHDSVFMKDSAILWANSNERVAVLTHPKFPSRQLEPGVRKIELEGLGFTTHEIEEYFEGGDLVFLPSKSKAYLGYGFRSEKGCIQPLIEKLNVPVVGVHLVDPYFYHLDVALNFTQQKNDLGTRQIAFVYPDALNKESFTKLKGDPDISEMVEVNRAEAMAFSLNWVEVNNTVILGASAPRIENILRELGKKVYVSPLDQFHLAGGSAACLSAQLLPLKQSPHANL